MNQKEMKIFKTKLLASGIFKRTNGTWYKCKYCPYCGDSKYHMYCNIDLDNEAPVGCNCFKCNTKCRLDKTFLDYYDLDIVNIPVGSYKRRIKSSTKVETALQDELTFDHIDNLGVCEYIQSRVGISPTLDDLKAFQYITNPKDYIDNYIGGEDRFLKNRYWFKMTNGNMLGRYYNDNTRQRWTKHKTSIIKQPGIYTIKKPFDTNNQITICIAEGVMDAIGLYYNYPCNNCVYIASLSQDYIKGIRHIINLGIFGKSVDVRIFKDSNVKTDNIIIPKNMVSLFNSVSIYQNNASHDYGVPADDIDISKIKRL